MKMLKNESFLKRTCQVLLSLCLLNFNFQLKTTSPMQTVPTCSLRMNGFIVGASWALPIFQILRYKEKMWFFYRGGLGQWPEHSDTRNNVQNNQRPCLNHTQTPKWAGSLKRETCSPSCLLLYCIYVGKRLWWDIEKRQIHCTWKLENCSKRRQIQSAMSIAPSSQGIWEV